MATQHRHGPPGVIVGWGGPFRSGHALDDARVEDVFPTVLHLLGLPVPEDALGRVLSSSLEEDFMERFAVRIVPSYSGLWKVDLPDVGRSGVLDAEELEKLRRMGYL